MKHILWCLKGTIDIGLVYHGHMFYALIGYFDFDYAADMNVR